MGAPLAYLLTWTTYGTWLHGDARGSADRSGEHQHGRPYIAQDDRRRAFAASELRHEPTVLNADWRDIVADTIDDHARIRDWRILALNVRTNHVHVVVASLTPPAKALNEFKAWSTRRLREAGLARPDTRVWTRHGSTRYLFTPESVQRAIIYVRDEQGPDPVR